jgi:hypothetical protein
LQEVQDASSALADAGPPHPSEDASTPVDVGPPDGSDDTSTPRDVENADTSPPRWCATVSPAPLFCDDFDVGALGATWSGGLQQSTATATLDSTIFESPPSSMLVAIPSFSSGGDGIAMLSTTFSAILNGASTYAFDLIIEAWDMNANYTKVASIIMPGGYAIYIQIDATGVLDIAEQIPAEDGGFAYGDYFGAPTTVIAPGVWHRIELRTAPPIDGGSGIASLTATFDHATVIDETSLEAVIPPGAPEIELGLYWVVPMEAPWRVHFDNVVFDMK